MTYSHRRYDPSPSSFSSSRSSRRQSRSHVSDHGQRTSSRAFDCCSRGSRTCSEPRRDERKRYAYDGRASSSSQASRMHAAPPSTYGTYIWPLEAAQGQHYRTMDPTRCRCNCCPHPSSISQQQGYHDKRRCPDATNGWPRSSTARPAPSSAHRSGNSSSSSSAAKPSSSRRSSSGRHTIDVVDKSDGSLRREYGRFYPISLGQDSSSASIASFLAPDKRRAKVIVHWDDGQTEQLSDAIPMRELIRYAEHLEVKEKKRVHWG
ncbi:hypothetical protein ACJ41O_014116 [Fusarium nematophilum]